MNRHHQQPDRRPERTGRRITTVSLFAILSTTTALAAGSSFNLGTPTNAVSTNQYFPLSGFRSVKGLHQPAGKTRVLFIGTLWKGDVGSSDERWPMVKALQQFGSFTHLHAFDRICSPDTSAQRTLCTNPTFDWSHATYRSSYLRFESRDIMRTSAKPPATKYSLPIEPYQRMNATELALYKRFVHVPPAFKDHSDPYGAFWAFTSGKLPLVVIGNYVQTSSQLLKTGDFQELIPQGGNPPPTPSTTGSGGVISYPSGLPFAQIQHDLQAQTDPPNTSLVEDVNAEANIITALICRADGRKPAKVCGRSAISSLLRHIR